MKVLICIPCLLTGGTEIQTLSLVKALVASDHEVRVACYFEFSNQMVERYRQTGVKVYLLSPNGSRPNGLKSQLFHLLKSLKKIKKDYKPDVAHVQYMAPGAIPILILKFLGIKRIVATAHTAADIYSSIGIKILRFLNNTILNGFQCISETAEISFFGNVSNNTKLKRHGNHFTIHNALPDYVELRADSRLIKFPDNSDPDKTITLGCVSRLEKIKGMDLVIPAFEAIHKKYPCTRLLIVGDGSLRKSMETIAEKSGLSEKITFVGRQPQERLQYFYDKIDILLMPSRSEGFGLTAIEGMARGCVPVVANTGGLPEVVRDGVDGLIHNPTDIEDMVNKISVLLENPVKLQEFSLFALQRGSEFSIKKYNNSVANWYHNLER